MMLCNSISWDGAKTQLLSNSRGITVILNHCSLTLFKISVESMEHYRIAVLYRIPFYCVIL